MQNAMERPAAAAPAISTAMFRRRYLWLALASWILPPVIGTTFEIFLGLISAEEVLRTVFAGFTGLFIAAFLVFASLALHRRTRRIGDMVEALPQDPTLGNRIGAAVRRLMLLHIGLFLLYSFGGPQTTLLTEYFLYQDAPVTTDWFSLFVGIVPPILLIALPLFFLMTDTLGRYLAPRGIMLNLAPLSLKFAVLGLVTPALVDITLILYFHDRTGFFGAEALIVWFGLLLVAGLGTALAWRSLKQSLSPMQRASGIARDPRSILPQSLDELGLLARDWRDALVNERRQEARFRNLVEGSIQGIFVVQGLHIVFANDTLARMLGYADAGAIYALPDASLLIAPEDRERVAGYARARAEGRDAPDRYEVRALRADGRTVWQEVLARPVMWNRAQAVQITVIDISERKQAEEALRDSEARFRDLIEGSIQGIFVHRDFELLFANRALAEMLGHETPEEVLAYGSSQNFAHPSERARLAGYKDARLAGKEVPDRYVFQAIRRDGSPLWVESIVRVVNWDGAPAVQATVVDVTERIKAEEALRRSEESLANAQRIARIGNWDWDIAEGSLHWSDEIYRIFGVDPHAFPATYEAFLEYVHPGDREAVTDAVNSALAGETSYAIDHRVRLADGTVRIVHEQAEIIHNDNGEPIGMRGIVQDITELRAAEAEVRRLNTDLERRVEQRTRELREAQAELIKKDRLATLGQLTATVSHELRNPLAAMRTSAYVLERSLPPGNEKARNTIARIERGIVRCDRIIDELLDFTRSTEIHREPVALDQWLAGVLSEQQLPPGVGLVSEFGLGDLVAMVDPERLRRAIINLVENAGQAIAGQEGWDAGAAGGLVTVTTAQDKDSLAVQVTDNGPGMTDNVRDKIFEPLFSTKTFGVGLGLPTVRQVVEQHGGTVSVDSHLDTGTTFRLVIPLKKPTAADHPAEGRPATVQD